MMSKITLPVFILLFISSGTHSAFAQHTVGLLSYDETKAFDGYNLFFPHNQSNVYLIDNCGEVVHVWEDDPSFRPGNSVYLLEDGSLVKCKRPSTVVNDPIWAGGGGATVEIRSWDNELLWSFTLNDSTARLHHDIEPLPNGNILMIAWEVKTREEAIEAGRDTNLLDDDELWPDYVLEVDPTLDSIVWEWHVWDHLVQDFDSTKSNYGVVADHPELLDINFAADGAANWMHTNSIDYNAELDQIVLSTPFLNEIYIIDHSTTTAQAADHVGGFGGIGGDFMYRLGNPAAYGVPDSVAGQQLFFQHHPHWIEDFLDGSDPQFGKMAIYNNQVGADYSAAHVFTPPWDMYTWSYTMNNGVWGPSVFEQDILHPDTTAMYSTGLSSVQKLPNGNWLLCSGRQGYSFELSPDNEIVWEYVTPLRGGNPVDQGAELELNENLTFRLHRYPADYSAFTERDLSGGVWIETNPDSNFCSIITPTDDLVRDFDITISPNPASTEITVTWSASRSPEHAEILNIQGQQIWTRSTLAQRHSINVSDWPSGLYYLRLNNGVAKKFVVKH